MPINGTAGNDNLVGTNGVNVFDASQGGKDFVSALGGDDIIMFGAELRASDEIHGGNAFDKVQLDGDYSFGLAFNAATMVEVEELDFASGHDYRLIMDDGNVAAGETLLVQGGLLASGKLIFNGGAELDGSFSMQGGAGDDQLTGGAQNDSFSMVAGGNDRVTGGGGNDTMTFGASLTRFDTIDGGTGTNTVTISGDYSAGLHFKDTGFKNIQTITLLGGSNSYDLTFEDGNVGAGVTLQISGNTLTAGHSLIVDGSRETDGKFQITGGAGDDTLTGGAKFDNFLMSLGGDDFVKGGGDTDLFSYGFSFNKQDHVDGGDGSDHLTIAGDYSAGIKLTSAQIVSIEVLNLTPTFDYKLQFTDGVVAAAQTLLVVADTLGVGDRLVFRGQGELDGRFAVRAGAADDALTGGSQNDLLNGGLGADLLHGGAGGDVYDYQNTAADSSGLSHDTIDGFDALADTFNFLSSVMQFPVSTVDAEITIGKLRSGNFDNDLSNAMAGLATRHAVLFTPDDGNLAGHTFLIVNANEVVGYQTGADLVFEMENLLNKASLDPTDF